MFPNPDILLIEDDEDDFVLTRDLIAEAFGHECNLEWRSSRDAALEALDCEIFDVCLVDYQLGECNGLDIVREAIDRGVGVPFIMLTGRDGREFDIDAVKAGATDYLSKSDISAPLLKRSVEYAIARQQHMAAERQAKELLKEANQKLAERYHTAHQFVDNVSHEFRTPLAVIKEFSSILADGLAGEVNDDQKEYLGIVINRVDDLAVMVDDMLDISKLEAGLLGVVRQETSPDAIFEDVRTTLERKAAANDATLTIAIDPALPFVYCDAQKIARVITNLAVNAFKFSGEGGKVSLWASHDPENSQIVVGVTDDGPGIAPENAKSIFDRFNQIGGDVHASAHGFGLGLNIVRELVHLNFGDIALESSLGVGSTFTFTIPEFDPPKIIERFMARIDQSPTGSSYISLITARMDPAAHMALATDVEEFLQYRLRRGDVLFGVEPGRWLLGAAIGEEPVENLLDSLEEAWTDANRDRRDARLPAIDFEINGIWRIRGGDSEFIDQFAAEFNSGQGNIGERGQPSDMGTAA